MAEDPEAKDADRLKALELLGRHLKLFTDRHEHAGPMGQSVQIVVFGEAAS